MKNELERTIGSGASFPIVLENALDNQGRILRGEDGKPLLGWQIVKGDIKLIEQNLKNIMFTLIGQRIRQESFGCRIYELLEEPNNRVIQHLASKFVSEAILQWEPRITQVKVEALSRFNKVTLKLYYQLVGSLEEGENILTLTYNI